MRRKVSIIVLPYHGTISLPSEQRRSDWRARKWLFSWFRDIRAMRICVYGAGAVGGHVAVRLARSGHDVSIITRGDNLAAIRANGLILKVAGEEFHARVAATSQPSDLGSQDFIISTLKANALGALAAGVAPLLGPNTAIVFAQNGLSWWYHIGLDHSPPVPPDLSRLDPCGALREAIEPVRVIGAVIHSSNEVVAPGIV